MIPREIQALFDVLEPLFSDQIKALRVEYQMNPGSRPEIELLLAALVERSVAGQSAVVPPPKGSVAGDYHLGDVLLGDQIWDSFGLSEDEWIQHVGIFGRSGSGKTNVGFLILRELSARRKPFLVFDWKRNYRDLMGHPEFPDLKVFTVGRDVAPFHFNPLIPPPGTEPEIFLKKLIEILMHVYWLGDGVAFLLQRAIDEVYREFGVYAGDCRRYPTLFDVRDWLRAYKVKGRESQWMDSTRRVMETLCFGQIGKVVNAASNEELRSLLSAPVMLELDALANADKTFLVESMLLWLHHLRLNQGERETFKHALLIEEAHHILLKRKESKETVVDIILREIRELGEAIIFLDQHPSMISTPSLGNSYCTIAMNLKHGNDTAALARAMGLSEEQRELVGRLPIGEALVKLQGRWPRPFLVRFPHLAVRKGTVRDDDLKRPTIGDSAIPPEMPRGGAPTEEIPPLPQSDREVSERERGLLEDVMEYPTAGMAERRARVGLSVRTLYSLVSSLTQKKLLVSSPVATPTGRMRILRLTEPVRGLLGVHESKNDYRRHESTEHWYWKLRLAEVLRSRGYPVEIERDGADLAVDKNGQRIAIELETGKSDHEANVRRDLERGFDQVIVVWIGSKAVPLSADDRVRSVTLGEFLRALSREA